MDPTTANVIKVAALRRYCVGGAYLYAPTRSRRNRFDCALPIGLLIRRAPSPDYLFGNRIPQKGVNDEATGNRKYLETLRLQVRP